MKEPAMPPALAAPPRPDFTPPSLRRLALATLGVIVLGFGGMLGWAFVAPLEGATPAGGSLVTQTRRQTVSLLESGILRDLLVREGDEVVAGQALLRLDDTQARAQAGQARARLLGASARAARLRAELADAPHVAFPAEVMQALDDPAIAAVAQAEAQLFETRRDALEATIAVQRRRIAQLHEQIGALSPPATARWSCAAPKPSCRARSANWPGARPRRARRSRRPNSRS
jgi:HlyD family secretion protein